MAIASAASTAVAAVVSTIVAAIAVGAAKVRELSHCLRPLVANREDPGRKDADDGHDDVAEAQIAALQKQVLQLQAENNAQAERFRQEYELVQQRLADEAAKRAEAEKNEKEAWIIASRPETKPTPVDQPPAAPISTPTEDMVRNQLLIQEATQRIQDLERENSVLREASGSSTSSRPDVLDSPARRHRSIGLANPRSGFLSNVRRAVPPMASKALPDDSPIAPPADTVQDMIVSPIDFPAQLPRSSDTSPLWSSRTCDVYIPSARVVAAGAADTGSVADPTGTETATPDAENCNDTGETLSAEAAPVGVMMIPASAASRARAPGCVDRGASVLARVNPPQHAGEPDEHLAAGVTISASSSTSRVTGSIDADGDLLWPRPDKSTSSTSAPRSSEPSPPPSCKLSGTLPRLDGHGRLHSEAEVEAMIEEARTNSAFPPRHGAGWGCRPHAAAAVRSPVASLDEDLRSGATASTSLVVGSWATASSAKSSGTGGALPSGSTHASMCSAGGSVASKPSGPGAQFAANVVAGPAADRPTQIQAACASALSRQSGNVVEQGRPMNAGARRVSGGRCAASGPSSREGTGEAWSPSPAASPVTLTRSIRPAMALSGGHSRPSRVPAVTSTVVLGATQQHRPAGQSAFVWMGMEAFREPSWPQEVSPVKRSPKPVEVFREHSAPSGTFQSPVQAFRELSAPAAATYTYRWPGVSFGTPNATPAASAPPASTSVAWPLWRTPR